MSKKVAKRHPKVEVAPKTVAYYMSLHYSIIITPVGDGFTAEIEDIPDCKAFGSTPNRIVRRLRDRLFHWIESHLKAGETIPEPVEHELDWNRTGATPSTGKTLEHYMSLPYPVRLFRLPEDGNWFAEIPLLPGCWTDAKTPNSVMTRLQDAKLGWLSISVEEGDDLNEPEPITELERL